ncbi:RNA methyltransferase [Bacteroides sp. 519]|uniref:RNA methyltransferase n=1 Tax=Bacteroides sp. 519 TaxID=2302937 RepID=UPI0013D28A8A|nr:RNA methyltransferase [Bacteroides sp. 519]NDV59749.1 RNA methyltransferase [Bacteroides sp. 519]
MTLSKNKIKYIHSLELKKKRKEEKVFLAEGPRLIEELLPCFQCNLLIATAEWLSKNPDINTSEIIEVNQEELQRVSLLKAPQQVLAVFKQPEYVLNMNELQNNLTIVLDDVQDPGNLGTIIRLADWFGIENVICSPNSAEVYNPKVIQATMGGIARVKVHYTPLLPLLDKLNNSLPVYGTFLDGENMYQQQLSKNGLIIMGNEGNGISSELEKKVSRKLYIPNYPADRNTSESLNVAIATAIVCAEFRRQG